MSSSPSQTVAHRRYDVVIRDLSKNGAFIEGLVGVPTGTPFVLDLGGGQLVVCEVKARASNAFGTPAEAVTPAKQLKVRRATADFRASLRASNDPLLSLVKSVRFDVACVLGTQLEMLEDIF